MLLKKFQKLKESITPGTILHLTGITGDSVTREYLKAYFSDYARVAWVDFERGNSQAWLRFHDANTAQASLEKTLEAHEDKLKTEFCIMEGRVLEGKLAAN